MERTEGLRTLCFNPTRVLLKDTPRCPARRGGPRFNPTRVLLKVDDPASPVWNAAELQPHKGSSESESWRAEAALYGAELQPHKGSSERVRIYPQGGSAFELQPHKGSSESRTIRRRLPRTRRFNPTRVLLKGCPEGRFGPGTARFNPTRVLLKGEGNSMSDGARFTLQPHKGSSERTFRRCYPAESGGFNPTRVLLKARRARPPRRESRCFNPTRVLLKGELVFGMAPHTSASTPQGFF